MSDTITRTIDAIADRSNSVTNECDYRNSEGILICGMCNQPKETRKKFPLGSGTYKYFPIKCLCDEQAEEEEAIRQKRDEIKRFIEDGIPDIRYRGYNFEQDDNRNPKASELCRKYIKHWSDMKESHYGILFYGDTGGGKSFYACCIANALVQSGFRVLVIRLSDLVKNRNNKLIQDIDLTRYELIVLDDVGVENATQTAYNIIDDIYKNNIPLLVTTNLSPSELKVPDTLDKQRIYDRILQMCCITQKIDVSISRLEIAKERSRKALNILNQ
ncbi:MAG: ATP-binding protein [Ruminococcus sp.]|nr:ATP-binding protein [Ruminococcus sp.]